MHTHARTHTHMHVHAHIHIPVAYQGNETEEKVFKEDLKELTEVEWWTETGTITPSPPHTPHPYI